MVRMLRARMWQDAGRPVPLDVDQVYGLPASVEASLVATGAAVYVGAAGEAGQPGPGADLRVVVPVALHTGMAEAPGKAPRAKKKGGAS